MRRCRSIVPVWCGGFAAVAVGLVARHPARAAQEPPPSPPAATRSVADLTTRFRFLEHYSATEERSKLEAIGPSKIAVWERHKVLIEKPQGAPERDEWTTLAKYTERPALLSGADTVSAVVRSYDSFQRTPDPLPKSSGPLLPKGLAIWYQAQPGEAPQVLSLAKERGLREEEFQFIERQIFLPELAAILPALPSRIGDKWRVPRTAIRALLGDRPLRGDPLTGTLLEVRKSAKGPNWEAVIGVTGRVALSTGETLVNARIHFQFPAPSAQADATPGIGGGDEATVNARGAITEVRMALSTSTGLPETNGRLRQITTREVVLERQLAAQGATLPPLPEAPPTLTEANSWLIYDDPLGRFQFRHPQHMRPMPQPDANAVVLSALRPAGPDTIDIKLQTETGNSEAARQRRDPEFYRKRLDAEWTRNRFEVIRGPSEWLPEGDWAAAKMKVYRIEAALSLGNPRTKGLQRVHADYYLVLFSRAKAGSLFVTSLTAQDPPLAFRKQVETLLKTFQFDTPQGAR